MLRRVRIAAPLRRIMDQMPRIIGAVTRLPIHPFKLEMAMKLHIALSVLILFILLPTDAGAFWTHSPSLRASKAKLSAEELGTLETIAKSLEGTQDSLRTINRYHRMANSAKSRGRYESASRYHRSANTILTHWRNGIWSGNPPRTFLVYPESMHGIRDAITDLVGCVRTKMPSSGPLTTKQLNIILMDLRRLAAADQQFANTVASRRVNPDILKPKVSLTFELKPFPFKLEVLNGEFKIKQSFNFGPLSGDAGVSFGSRQGITTLVLVHGNYRRVYAVGGRRLSFDLPASYVDINGNTITITTK